MVFAIDGGPWDGPVSWRKPITFGLSFGLSVLTVTWIAAFIRLGDRPRARLLTVFAVASVVEVGLTALQMWRGVPSHFNLETTFNAIVARALAVGGVTLIVVVVALTIASFRANPTVAPSMRLAVATYAGIAVLVGVASATGFSVLTPATAAAVAAAAVIAPALVLLAVSGIRVSRRAP